MLRRMLSRLKVAVLLLVDWLLEVDQVDRLVGNMYHRQSTSLSLLTLPKLMFATEDKEQEVVLEKQCSNHETSTPHYE